MSQVLLYLGAILTVIWGISHLIPTRNVVTGFGDISEDNRNIIMMEWIVEGVSLIFIGALVAILTYIGPLGGLSKAAYAVVTAGLLALAIVSLFTGFKVKFLPFRLCPFILTISAALVFVGGVL
jgi:hypothetical protein